VFILASNRFSTTSDAPEVFRPEKCVLSSRYISSKAISPDLALWAITAEFYANGRIQTNSVYLFCLSRFGLRHLSPAMVKEVTSLHRLVFNVTEGER
jgi:hypothetical protein